MCVCVCARATPVYVSEAGARSGVQIGQSVIGGCNDILKAVRLCMRPSDRQFPCAGLLRSCAFAVTRGRKPTRRTTSMLEQVAHDHAVDFSEVVGEPLVRRMLSHSLREPEETRPEWPEEAAIGGLKCGE